MDELSTIRLLLLFVLLVGAAYTDIARRKIYNWLTIPATLAGLLLAGVAALAKMSWMPMLPCAIGIGAGLVFYIFFFLGWVGGGDVKLMVAIGALQGPPLDNFFIFKAIFYTSLAGACMALVLLAWEGRLLRGLANSGRLLLHPKRHDVDTEPHGTIPYGLAMVIGTVWTLVMAFAVGMR